MLQEVNPMGTLVEVIYLSRDTEKWARDTVLPKETLEGEPEHARDGKGSC